jgi:CheY-like chemotaxis protein
MTRPPSTGARGARRPSGAPRGGASLADPPPSLARYRAPLLKRLDAVEAAVARWAGGQLTAAARDEAATEAHRLAGTLGMFGAGAACDAAREVELLLRAAAPGDRAGASECRRLVARLRAGLDRALALAPEADAPPGAGVPAEPPRAGAPRSILWPPRGEPSGVTVMVADDDEVIARLLASALTRDGHAVLWAHDGAEAVQLARSERVHVVLMDVQMPIMGGVEACATLRADPRTAALPVVLMSADARPESGPDGLAAGASACLPKPFRVADVRRTIRALVTDPA